MSYILEALKKSEQERQRGTTPSLQTVQIMPLRQEPRGRVLWPYLILAALFLNACLFMWWLHPWRPERPTVDGREAMSVPPPSVTGEQPKSTSGDKLQVPARLHGHERDEVSGSEREKNQSKPSPQSALQVAKEEVANAPGTKGERVGKPERTMKEASPTHSESPAKEINRQVTKPPNAARTVSDGISGASKASPVIVSPSGESSDELASKAKKVEERIASAVPTRPDGLTAAPNKETSPTEVRRHTAASRPEAKGNLRTGPPPVNDNMPKLQVPLTTEEPLPPASRPPADPRSSVDAQPGPEQNVPSFSALPLTTKAAIPRMSISMLVYSKSPSERMISINGKMMHEGQEVAPGLKLEQITQNGGIFNYKGQRFHRGVF